MENRGIVIATINQKVEEDVQRYQNFLTNIERLLVATMVSTDMSEQAARQFRTALLATLNGAVRAERLAVNSQTATLLDNTGQANLSPSTVRAAIKTVKEGIVAQMTRDAVEVERHFARIRTTAYLINEARPMGESHAMRLAYFQNQPLLKHLFIDRAGRRWKSSSYVRTLFRWHYLELVNDLEVMALANAGVSDGALVHPNGSRVLFSVTGSGVYPSYAVAKQQHLHPNSNALVQAAQEEAAQT